MLFVSANLREESLLALPVTEIFCYVIKLTRKKSTLPYLYQQQIAAFFYHQEFLTEPQQKKSYQEITYTTVFHYLPISIQLLKSNL